MIRILHRILDIRGRRRKCGGDSPSGRGVGSPRTSPSIPSDETGTVAEHHGPTCARTGAPHVAGVVPGRRKHTGELRRQDTAAGRVTRAARARDVSLADPSGALSTHGNPCVTPPGIAIDRLGAAVAA